MTVFEQAFADAAAISVTICCASGDNGSSDGEADGKPHLDFPSLAPHALGCGGTKLLAPATGAPTETVWNAGASSATGGGYSGFFPVPDCQAALAMASPAGACLTSPATPTRPAATWSASTGRKW